MAMNRRRIAVSSRQLPVLTPVSNFGFGSGVGIRTLNLAVNRSTRQLSEIRIRIRQMSLSTTIYHGSSQALLYGGLTKRASAPDVEAPFPATNSAMAARVGFESRSVGRSAICSSGDSATGG